MSLVENLINQISTGELGGISKPQGFDLNDDTFAKLLEKQLNSPQETQTTNLLGNIGAPAGFMIEPMEGIEFSETAQDQIEALGENKYTYENNIDEPIKMKDVDMGDYFSTLLQMASDNNSNFLNFAKRQASNAYSVFRGNYITDLQEFAQDIVSMT